MGRAVPFTPQKLIIPTLVADEEIIPQLLNRLSESFGAIEGPGARIPFEYTDYYQGEMGGALVRIFLAGSELVDPQRLAAFKLATNLIETEFARSDGSRVVNLDPGLLSEGRLILATTKDRAQRIPLQDGVFAEVTLFFRRGAWEPLQWTYPDYASGAYDAELTELRERYRLQLHR